MFVRRHAREENNEVTLSLLYATIFGLMVLKLRLNLRVNVAGGYQYAVSVDATDLTVVSHILEA